MTIRLRGSGEALLAVEVIFVVAGIDVDMAALDLEHARGDAVDEVAIVGDKDDGAAEIFDRFEQDVFGAKVEVIGGFVKEKEIGRTDENARECVTVAFAAREYAERLKGIVAGEEKATQQAAQLGFRDARSGAADIVEHARGRIEHLVLILSEVFGANIMAELEGSSWRAVPRQRACE